jgi:Protein of unknown function (DUF4236)
MGWRFRRSWTVIPGVRVNLGRKSGSVSFGVRGLHYTVGTSGSRITAGIPGTGLFWTQKLKSRQANPTPPSLSRQPQIYSPAPGNMPQIPAQMLTPAGPQTQPPLPVTSQVFSGAGQSSPQLQKHVFIPLWTVWTTLTVVLIGGLCVAAATLGKLVH